MRVFSFLEPNRMPHVYRNHPVYVSDKGLRSIPALTTHYLIATNLARLLRRTDPRRAAQLQARADALEAHLSAEPSCIPS